MGERDADEKRYQKYTSSSIAVYNILFSMIADVCSSSMLYDNNSINQYRIYWTHLFCVACGVEISKSPQIAKQGAAAGRKIGKKKHRGTQPSGHRDFGTRDMISGDI